MKAVWKNQVLAESDETIVIEGNHYFPPESIHKEFFQESDQTSVCPWKGLAGYYDIVIGDDRNAVVSQIDLTKSSHVVVAGFAV